MKTIEALDIAIRRLQSSVQSHYDLSGRDDEHLAMEILNTLRATLSSGARITFMGDTVYKRSGFTDEFEMDHDEIGEDHYIAGHSL